MATPLPKRNGKDGEDRTNTLRILLQYPTTFDDVVPLVREIARLVIWFDNDLRDLSKMKEILEDLRVVVLDFLSNAVQEKQHSASPPAGDPPKPTSHKFMSWEYMKERVFPSVIAWMLIAVFGFVFYGIYLAIYNALRGDAP